MYLKVGWGSFKGYKTYTESPHDIHVIANQLNFEDHMNEKINKANSIMGLIRHTFTYIDEPTFLMLYKALVGPHIEYANSVWNPYKKKTYYSILQH